MSETEYNLHRHVLYFNISKYVFVHYKLVIDTNFDTMKIQLFKILFPQHFPILKNLLQSLKGLILCLESKLLHNISSSGGNLF